MKVVFCTPTRDRPSDAYIAAMEASVPALDAAGLEHYMVTEVGSAYISWARANMLRKALDIHADAVVFLDDDLSWAPDALVRLVQTKQPVVGGLYRFKSDDGSYMGELLTTENGRPQVTADGLILATKLPGGFLKITADAVVAIMRRHPELIYGVPYRPLVDLFNHGAHGGLWWGEDYAFSRRWTDDGGELFILPDLDITHHGRDGKSYPGNYHEYLLRQPGGAKDPQRMERRAA